MEIVWPQTRREWRRSEPRPKPRPKLIATPEDVGYAAGVMNRASAPYYTDGGDYIAWLKGWRRGQREFILKLPAFDRRRVWLETQERKRPKKGAA